MRAVLFELEDVLVETAAARRDAVARSLNEVGMTTVDATDAELAALRAERYFAERVASGVTLVDGARGSIESLGRHVRLGVVTTLRRREAEFVVELAGLDAVIAFIISADDVRRAKPAPDGYHRALARLTRLTDATSARADTLALESTADGIRAARAAGVRVVGVGRAVSTLAGTAPTDAAADAWIPTVAHVTYDSLTNLPLPAAEHDR